MAEIIDFKAYVKEKKDKEDQEELDALKARVSSLMSTLDLTPQPYFMSLEEMTMASNLTHHSMDMSDIVDAMTQIMIALDRLGHDDLGEKMSNILSDIFFRLEDED
jgi:enoyl reductase-like protein